MLRDSRMRVMLLEMAEVADPVEMATQFLDSCMGKVDGGAPTTASWVPAHPAPSATGAADF